MTHIPKLALHRRTYAEVPELVKEWIFSNQDDCPIMIDCGKSGPKMMEIAMEVVKGIPCSKVKKHTYMHSDGTKEIRTGYITILRV